MNRQPKDGIGYAAIWIVVAVICCRFVCGCVGDVATSEGRSSEPETSDAGAREATPEAASEPCPCVDSHKWGICSYGSVEWHCGTEPRNPSTIPACEAIGGGCIYSGTSDGAWCCDR